MGKPSQNALAIPATVGVPPQYDKANFVIGSGLNGAPAITAIGPTQSFYAYGPFNVAIWGSAVTSTSLSAAQVLSGGATVTSGTGLGNGGGIFSPAGLVPPGTTYTISGTTLTLQLPPGFSVGVGNGLVAGTDANMTFAPVGCAATINLEKSYDGGNTWLLQSLTLASPAVGASWVMASQGAGPPNVPVVLQFGEVEQGMLYRLNCVAYTSGTIQWRISGTGAAAIAWAVSRIA